MGDLKPKKSPKGILFFTVFLDLLGYGLIIPLLPEFARSLGASSFVIGIVIASYSFAQFLFGPILGNLSDRFGRRPILLWTIALSAVAYGLFSVAGSIIALLIARMIAGTAAANLSVAQAYITDVTPPKDRAKALGLIGAALGLGFIFGPPIGGFVKESFGVASVGYVGFGLASLNLLLGFIRLKESNANKGISNRKLTLLDFASLKESLQSKQIEKLFLVYFLFTLAFAMLTITGALLWKDRFGLNTAQVGYTFAFIGFITALVQGLIGKLVPKFGEAKLLKLGLAFMVVGLSAMPFVPENMFVLMELICIAVFALGYSLVMPTGTALVSLSRIPESQGQILGQYQSIASLARIIGPVLGGAFYGMNNQLSFVVGGAIMALAVILAQPIHKEIEAPIEAKRA